MLEEWQYQDLKAASERQGRSLSSLVRDAVTEFLRRKQRPNRTRLAEITGIGEDAGSRGRDHDEVLYGPARTRE